MKKLKNKKIIIPVSILGLLVIGYLCLCFVVSGKDFLSNTTINGLSVGNLTVDEAKEALSTQIEKDTESLQMVLKADDQTYQVNMNDNILIEDISKVDEISSQVSGSFLMRGYYYFMDHDFYVPVTVKDEEELIKDIEESKVLSYDTKVETTYEVKDNQITFTKGQTGKKTDQEDIVNKIKEALSHYQLDQEIECDLVDSQIDDATMESIHTKLNQSVQNATLDKDNDYAIVEEKVGIDYDLDQALEEYKKTKEGETFTVDVSVIQPTVTKEDLKENLFKDLLASYSTTVGGSSGRRTNVGLAAKAINNKIVLSGEQFSYNKTLGKRTREKGYQEGSAIINGESTPTVGGGICQTSTTLYNAVLLSNLEIVTRRNHTYPSSYVPLGLDATVSWGSQDFVFENSSDYPIKIVSSYDGKTVNVKIYGTNLENITVKMTNKVLSTKEYSTTYVDDPTLEEGKTKVKTSGETGYTVQTYRNVYKNGKLISTTKEAYSSYKKRDKVVLRGTKKKSSTTTQSSNNQTNSSTTNTNTTDTTNTTESVQ